MDGMTAEDVLTNIINVLLKVEQLAFAKRFVPRALSGITVNTPLRYCPFSGGIKLGA
jgi:hypothetical protein